MTVRWSDLSGAELQARLVQRGVGLPIAEHLVRHRERRRFAAVITGILTGKKTRA